MKSLKSVGKVSFVIAAAVLMLAGTTCLFAIEKPEEGVVKIKIGLSPYQDVSSLIVADKKGFFAEEGLEPEFIPIGWAESIETIVGGAVDFANTADAGIAGKTEKIKNIVFTNLLFLWEADALIGQKGSTMKTFNDFKAEGMSDAEAAKTAIRQIKGKVCVVPRNTAQENWLGEVAKYAGLDFKTDIDPYILDMGFQEGLAAFIGGEGDILLPGIPQRNKLTELGHPIIVNQKEIPVAGMVQHAGFATRRDYADEHFDVVVRFQAVIYKTLKWIEDNKMEGFTIISDYLNTRTAAGMTPEALRDKYWNILETFPLPEDAYKMTILPDGSRYWKTRWERAFQYYVETEVYSEIPSDWKDYVLWPEVLEAYLKDYEPDLYKKLK